MKMKMLMLLIAASASIEARPRCDLKPTTVVLDTSRFTLQGEYSITNFLGLSGTIGDPSPLACDSTVKSVGGLNLSQPSSFIEQLFNSNATILDTIIIRKSQNFNSITSPQGSSISFHSLGFKETGTGQRELRFDASASTTPGNVLITAVWVDLSINSQSVVAVFDLLPSDNTQIITFISNQSITIQTNDGTNGIIVSTAQNKATYSRFGSLNEQGMQVGASLTFSSYAECPNSRKGESCFQ